MPQAAATHTPSPVIVALQLAATNLPPIRMDPGMLTYQDAILRDACRSALVTHGAMTALALSVADLSPGNPLHEAADAAIAHLRPLWSHEVEQAWTVPAAGWGGLRDKAELLATLIDRDENGAVPGSPSLSLAASLAADVLQHWAATQ